MPLFYLYNSVLWTLSDRIPDCSCQDFVNSNGYGNCKKIFLNGPICYVNQPSTCNDTEVYTSTDDNKELYYSWLACKNTTGKVYIGISDNVTNALK